MIKIEITSFDKKKIKYFVYGNPMDPPIVFIHGHGADAEMWNLQIPFFNEHGFFCIIPEMRGHGASDPVEKFSIDNCARDISIILEHLSITKCHCVGVSMGGLITQAFITEYPEKCLSAVICDSFSEIANIKEYLNAKLAVWGFKLLKHLPNKWFVAQLEKSYNHPNDKLALMYLTQKFENPNYNQLLISRKGINKFKLQKELIHLKIPILVLAGDGFNGFLVKTSKKIVSKFKSAKLIILTDSKDPSNLIVPNMFNKIVLDFLKKYSC
ncbi:alpha/beta fold hydrolase [Candidatus Harpocratesius sp.]